jgi:hypothetical protein
MGSNERLGHRSLFQRCASILIVRRLEELKACSEVRPVNKPIAQWTLIALIGCVRVLSEHKVDGRNLPLSEWA